MKRLLVNVILPALCAAASPRTLADCRSLASRFLECSGSPQPFAVHLPEGQPKKAVLFLHGAGRDHLTLFRSAVTRRAIEASRAVIVFPRGGLGWWLDTPDSAFETSALEAMDRVAAALGVPAGPTRWSAAGWSMGGFGSLRLVVHHPGRFGAWGGILSLADFPNPAYPKNRNHSVPALFGPPDGWSEWNPFFRVHALQGKRVWFATGAEAFDRDMNDALSRRLRELRIPHEYSVVPGGHEFRVVEDRLPALLHFLEDGP